RRPVAAWRGPRSCPADRVPPRDHRGALGAHTIESPLPYFPESSVHILPAGPDAALVELATTTEALSLADWARARDLVDEVVPGARTVLLDGVPDELPEPERLARGVG